MSTQRARYEDWDETLDGPTLTERFKGRTYTHYREFRGKDASRYLTLCLPRRHVREPFGSERAATGLDWYTETVRDVRDLTSTGVASALGGRVLASMGKWNWPSAIIGQDYGGKVDGLALVTFTTGTGEELENCPTVVGIDDELEVPLEKLGFLSQVHVVGTGTGVFYAAPTVQKALRGRDPQQAASAELAARLPNLLISSRFAHFLRVMLRALIGAGKTPKEIQDELQSWANDYVLEAPEGSGESDRARRPFRRIKITVKDCEGQPGHLDAVVELEPHYRAASFTATLLITADIDDGDSQ